MTLCYFCFYNNYIVVNGKFFKQICGIGMGTNYSSYAANLFLFYSEYKHTVKVNKSFKIFPYIDNVLVINADLIDIFDFIYPCCLKIKKASTSDKIILFWGGGFIY